MGEFDIVFDVKLLSVANADVEELVQRRRKETVAVSRSFPLSRGSREAKGGYPVVEQDSVVGVDRKV